MINQSVLNPEDGMSAITSFACSSTEGWIAWVVVVSLWILIFFLVLNSIDQEWALAAASLPSLMFAIGFAIFGCTGAVTLIILLIILSAVGLARGFVG